MAWTQQGSIRGPQGVPGDPGVAGRGLASALLNENGELVLTFDDGSPSVNVGVVRGATGETGSTGIPGTPGRGITQVTLNGDDLLVDFTDGTQATVQGIRGPAGERGADGTSVQIAGSVADAASLPTGLGAADAGQGYITSDTGHLHVWSGSAFNDVGNVTGPAGPQGPQGLQGSPGVRGTFWYFGNGAPTENPAGSRDGDLYLDFDSGTVYVLGPDA